MIFNDVKLANALNVGSAKAWVLYLAFCLLAVLVVPVSKAEEVGYFEVSQSSILEHKAVFATVESLKVVPARVRISGTIAEVLVVEGDFVHSGERIASVGDDKLALQVLALDSRIQGLVSQSTQALTDFRRMEALLKMGSVSQATLDSSKTTLDVADNNLKAVRRERDVVRRQLDEGAVLAPVSGRILRVPLTAGTVVMPGEELALLAEENYILRLEIPERHARYMTIGDPVQIAEPEIGDGVSVEGKITRIYPHIENGRVYADAYVEGLGNYFFGQRIRVRIPAGEHPGIVIPIQSITTRSGIDWVKLENSDGRVMDISVRVGRITPDGVEILSGLVPGDRIRVPVQ